MRWNSSYICYTHTHTKLAIHIHSDTVKHTYTDWPKENVTDETVISTTSFTKCNWFLFDWVGNYFSINLGSRVLILSLSYMYFCEAMSFSKIASLAPKPCLKQQGIFVWRHSIESAVLTNAGQSKCCVMNWILPFHSLLFKFSKWEQSCIVNTPDSMEYRQAEISWCFNHGFGCQILRMTLPPQNIPRIKMPIPKLMILVSFYLKKKFLLNVIKSMTFVYDIVELTDHSCCILFRPSFIKINVYQWTRSVGPRLFFLLYQ